LVLGRLRGAPYMTFTIDELKERMKERESPDDILDLLSPTTEELVEALAYMLDDNCKLQEELQSRYE